MPSSVKYCGPDNLRWTATRKADIIKGLRKGTLSRENVLRFYNISPEELEIWQNAYGEGNLQGLKVTRIRRRRADGSPRNWLASDGVVVDQDEDVAAEPF